MGRGVAAGEEWGSSSNKTRGKRSNSPKVAKAEKAYGTVPGGNKVAKRGRKALYQKKESKLRWGVIKRGIRQSFLGKKTSKWSHRKKTI